MNYYLAKPVYDEYVKNINIVIESLLLTDCPFIIQCSLCYLCGALNFTFKETSFDVVSVDAEEWNDYLLHLQEAILYLDISESTTQHAKKLKTIQHRLITAPRFHH